MAVSYHRIYLRVSQSEYEKFMKLRQSGFSARQVLENICERYTDSPPIVLFNITNGEPVSIPTNILVKRRK